jgi:Replication protein
VLSIEKINKRARSKYTQEKVLEALAGLNTKYQSKYQDSLNCSSLIYHQGGKLTSRYCRHRWCRICNRIRTGLLINGYAPALEGMRDKQFLTLTIPNVPGKELRITIKKMIATVRGIQEYRRQKLKLPGINCIRKLECTYNAEKNNYHPHFHFIIDGLTEANYLLEAWLEKYPEADRRAQKIVEAYNPAELFKYFTKLTSKTSTVVDKKGKIRIAQEYHFPEALDTIFQAIERVRIIQPMGKIKLVQDDIDELHAEEIDETVEQDAESNKFYVWNGTNWYSPYTGVLLSSFEPNKNLRIFADKIRYLERIPAG